MKYLVTLGACAALACSSLLQAADHLDGPAVANDPAADINDLYVFINPQNPGELILAATVMPLATADSRFSDVVDYQFRLQNTDGTAEQIIECRFRGKAVICNGPGETEVAGPVGRVNTGEDGLRVFAGLRDDPFFFDLLAYLDTVNTLVPQFSDPGSNFFNGLNALSIVIGVDTALLAGDSPVYQVWAATRRGEKKGVNAATTQVDRMGRPAVNTALIDLLASTGLKNQYNQADNPATWPAQFQAEIAANLAALDTLDGVLENYLLPPMVLASVLVDDRLLVDVSQPVCDAYLAVELAVPQCGGRTLARDVIDDTFGAVVGPGVSDFVANDSTFLADFPFLGHPN
jgi:hypothetical protein